MNSDSRVLCPRGRDHPKRNPVTGKYRLVNAKGRGAVGDGFPGVHTALEALRDSLSPVAPTREVSSDA